MNKKYDDRATTLCSLNGTDVKFIREMAALVSINMKEAKIVSGGEFV